MEEIYCIAGKRIRNLREKKHYTRDVLSELAGISNKFLYEIEYGQKGFSANTLYKLAEALGTTTDYILYGNLYSYKEYEEIQRIFRLFDEANQHKIILLLEFLLEIQL